MTSIIVPKRSLVLPQGSRGGIALPQSQRGFMVVNPSRFGGGTPAVTWNPADIGLGVQLTNSNLTMRRQPAGSTWCAVRATTSKATGKWYFEAKLEVTVGGPDMMVGLANSSLVLSGNYCGSSTGSYGLYTLNGNKYNNSTGTAYGSAQAVDDVIGIGYDADAGKIWFSINNVWIASGNPAAGTNPAFTGVPTNLFPCASVFDQNDAYTGRWSAADITGTIPAGFSAWG